MSSVVIQGDTSGSVTLEAPAVAGSVVVTLPDTSGTAITSSSLGYNSFKNRIINGSCAINQRGSQSGLGANSAYTIDRWILARENASQAARFTVTNTALTSSDTPLIQDGLSYTLQANVTTASGGILAAYSNYFTQRIEGFNVADFGWGTASAKSVTLSFWAKTVNKTGTMAVSLYSGAARNYVQTISMTTSWQKFTLTFPGDTGGSILTSDNSNQLQLMFVMSAGSNFQVTANQWNAGFANSASGQADFTDSTSNVLYFTGVQLEKGSTATSFDYRPYGTELALCQRYAIQVVNGESTQQSVALGQGQGATTANYYYQASVAMRTGPALTYSALGDFLNDDGVGGSTPTSLTIARSTTLSCTLVGGGLTTAAGRAAHLRANNSSARLLLSAEL